jgi:hypothetical protein
MAQLYSTLKPAGREMAVGARIPKLCQLMQQRPWLDLNSLFAVQEDSPLCQQRNLSGPFYAQSWALVHMLSLSRACTLPQFGDFLQSLTSGKPHDQGFESVYSKSTQEVTTSAQSGL